jgi:hypothetical protein
MRAGRAGALMTIEQRRELLRILRGHPEHNPRLPPRLG